jgi:hypothetical protein
MHLWQNSISSEVKEVSLNEELDKYKKYERKIIYNEPQLLFAMLNAQVKSVYANEKFSIFLCSDSQTIYSTGYDYRQVEKEDLYGIPR